MKRFKANRAINGTYGRLWVNDEERGNVKSFEAKITLNYEEIGIADDIGTHQKYMGYAIEGTMTFTKMDSYFIRLYRDGIISGELPEVSVVTKLADPAAFGAERVKLSGVTLDEIMLTKFENKTITEEEVPFKAEAFELLDMIA